MAEFTFKPSIQTSYTRWHCRSKSQMPLVVARSLVCFELCCEARNSELANPAQCQPPIETKTSTNPRDSIICRSSLPIYETKYVVFSVFGFGGNSRIICQGWSWAALCKHKASHGNTQICEDSGLRDQRRYENLRMRVMAKYMMLESTIMALIMPTSGNMRRRRPNWKYIFIYFLLSEKMKINSAW